MNILVTTEHMDFFECFSSYTRIKILEILGEGTKNIGELAKLLGISSAIISRHITLMEKAGLIKTENVPGKRGLQKVCSLCTSEITLSFKKELLSKKHQNVSIPIGQYVAYDVKPTCGLASIDGLIGLSDDPRYFGNPERVNAALIWFQTGWIQYSLPSYLLPSKHIDAIEISLELCSEYPAYKNDWPSDIHFYLNDVLIGVWTSPGDFGDKKGNYTPQWWRSGTEYGLLKTIRITRECSKIDGLMLSDVNIDRIPIQYGKDLSFRIAVPEEAKNPGGINLFGKGFGNYNQDIVVRVEYE